MMRGLAIDPIAGAPHGVLGLSRIRGEVMPVLHLGALLGEPLAQPRYLVTVALGERRVALAVDRVVGVHVIAEAALQPLPPVMRGAAGDVLTAIGTLDRELLLFLETARLVSHGALAALHADPA
jgi:chemotaxis signal transduction protein